MEKQNNLLLIAFTVKYGAVELVGGGGITATFMCCSLCGCLVRLILVGTAATFMYSLCGCVYCVAVLCSLCGCVVHCVTAVHCMAVFTVTADHCVAVLFTV